MIALLKKVKMKLKLSKAEALKSKLLKEQLKTDIIEGQRENFKIWKKNQQIKE